MFELSDDGHQVDLSDDRFHGFSGTLVRWFRNRLAVNPIDLKTLFALQQYDIVIAKDDFSTMLTLACRVLRRPLIYVDSLFGLPRRAWRRKLTKFNIVLATKTVSYSRSQIALWVDSLMLPAEKMAYLPYTIDGAFYRLPKQNTDRKPEYILSIGRDLARDFPTLVRAVRQTGLRLKLVTLPPLLSGIQSDAPWIDVLERVPYDVLFRLYAGATAVVIPLRKGTTYPSGVRALLEGMSLAKPVIASRTPVLLEYARHGVEALFVEPENTEELREAILSVKTDPSLASRIGRLGQQAVRERFGMQAFAKGMLQLLTQCGREETTCQG
jgi:glycosyltransferase involved in cell wall biosynthesis